VDLAGPLADHVQEPPGQLDDLGLRARAQEGVAADDLLGLGERPVGDGISPPAFLWMRTPSWPNCTPSVAINQPAFIPSSMSLPIAAISAWVGGTLCFFSCVKKLM
jgi:hypothetical protein